MKVIIVGGVAGGATAAARIRRLDETAEILVFERSGYVSYANCGLPYYIGGIIRDRKELTLQTPESFRARFNVDVRVHHEVTAIHPQNQTVTVRDLESGRVFEETYDRLLLSPGARPVVPELPGRELDGIFSLRTVEDTFRIREYVDQHRPSSAVLVGGGYIGLEMAENLTELGIAVTVVQRPRQVMSPLDYDMACQVHSLLRRHGVSLRLGSSVTGFASSGGKLQVLLRDEEPVSGDMVLLAVGVAPDTDLARNAGLRLGLKGSIAVNERMETSQPGIYAVGDAVEVTHSVTGQKALISLAGPANRQGRIAADNICGGHSVYPGSQGSSVLRLFETTIATTGINEKAAQVAGLDYDRVLLSSASHARYYPGARNMTIKVLFEKASGRILGAQILGGDGADKRIDVLATAIRAGMTADDLTELDLAYAPPYSSAKDPVNMAGYVIQNVLTGKVRQFHWDQVDTLPRDGSVTLLDVRTPREFEAGHMDGFINIPLDSLRERLGEIPLDKPVYVTCQVGLRSYIACRILSQHGYDCQSLSGGYGFWAAVTQERCVSQAAPFPCGMEKS